MTTLSAPRSGAEDGARLLVVLDADSTLLADEVIELIADAAGTREEVAGITDRAMRGELDFAASLAERVATLEGLPVEAFKRIAAAIRLSPGARELVGAVHAAGGVVGVVSGGFAEFLEPIARDLAIDRWRANRLESIDGRLTGRVAGSVVDAAAKADALRTWAAELGVPAERTIAVGDGANDLAMMAAARLAVAFAAKPAVRAAADVVVAEPDLRTVIPLLGL